MDWMRRNWPDLLIGVALVAVIAGIIATLLTGGSFFPLGQSSRTVGQTQSQSTGPTGDVLSTPPNGAGVQSPAGVDSANGGGSQQVPVTALPLPGTPSANSLPVIPSVGGDEPGSAADPANDAGTPVDSQAAGGQTQGASPVAGIDTQTGAQNPAQNPAQSPSQNTTPAASDGVYRVSVGAFSTNENAERQAATFRAAGYPVFLATQGNLWLVLVGPYEELGVAERVAAEIGAGDFDIDPVVYRFRPDAASEGTTNAGASAAAAQNGAQNSAQSSSQSRAENGAENGAQNGAQASVQNPAQAGAQEPARNSAPAAESTALTPQPTAGAAAGGQYLQVGAYANEQSALPQQDLLEGLGFRVTQRLEGDLLKLLVGPFSGDELAGARSRLNAQGIEHFPR